MTLLDQIQAAPQLPAIYQIVCTANGRRYVGSAANLRKRWREHFRQLSASKHHSQHMQRSWAKHGPEAFAFSVVEYCEREALIEREQFHIDAMGPEFNTSPMAGSQLGFRHSPEAKAKMSEAAKRTRNFTGHKHSEDSKRRISEGRKGKGATGWTDERRRKIGAAHKGVPKAEDQKRKISESLKGTSTGRGSLTEAQVREVRALRAIGLGRLRIAARMGINEWAADAVIGGHAYGWVK